MIFLRKQEYYDELYHYGVLGMKWGVHKDRSSGYSRKSGRVSNKQIRDDREKFRKEAQSSLSGEALKASKRRKEVKKEMYQLMDKYDFDHDDGGGGRTASDRKAGAKYMKLNDELMWIDDIIENDVRTRASKKLVEKYGTKRIDQFKTAENVKAGMAVAAVAAAAPVVMVGGTVVVGVGIAGMAGYAGAKSIKNKITGNKKKEK